MIDAVAQQRDAHASRLFWHTDLASAKADAARSGKPILSLRLLGNLDEDRSCANSRFFRSVLYANENVSGWLREHYVLHWQSLRPVPKLSIDFGDGRRIERTITGNSIHYILDPNGEIIDAIPGLYGPQAFMAAIQMGEAVALNAMAQSDSAQRREFLNAYHRQAVDGIVETWLSDLRSLGVSEAALATAVIATSFIDPVAQTSKAGGALVVAGAGPVIGMAPPAARRSRRRSPAPTKSGVELRILNALDPRSRDSRAAATHCRAGSAHDRRPLGESRRPSCERGDARSNVDRADEG